MPPFGLLGESFFVVVLALDVFAYVVCLFFFQPTVFFWPCRAEILPTLACVANTSDAEVMSPNIPALLFLLFFVRSVDLSHLVGSKTRSHPLCLMYFVVCPFFQPVNADVNSQLQRHMWLIGSRQCQLCSLWCSFSEEQKDKTALWKLFWLQRRVTGQRLSLCVAATSEELLLLFAVFLFQRLLFLHRDFFFFLSRNGATAAQYLSWLIWVREKWLFCAARQNVCERTAVARRA